jgi:hypothetical protein
MIKKLCTLLLRDTFTFDREAWHLYFEAQTQDGGWRESDDYRLTKGE